MLAPPCGLFAWLHVQVGKILVSIHLSVTAVDADSSLAYEIHHRFVVRHYGSPRFSLGESMSRIILVLSWSSGKHQ